MKQIIHKIASFLMAVVVLFSTMSFTIDMHYCGDTLVDTAIFSKVHTCGMEMQKFNTKECSVKKKNCCSDEQIVIDGQDELKSAFSSLSIDQQLFATSFVYAYINLFEGLDKNIISYRDYTPPLVEKTIYKLDESYII